LFRNWLCLISSLKEIVNSIINLGLTALKFGFKVKYVGWNPILINGNDDRTIINKEENIDKIKKVLKEKSKKYKRINKFYVDTPLKFLELGSELVFEKLNIEKLKNILDKEKFFLVEVKPAFFMNKTTLEAMHKVIVV
jgi:hypothetical protein